MLPIFRKATVARFFSSFFSHAIYPLVLILLSQVIHCVGAATVSRQWSARIVTTKFGLVRGFVFLPKGYEGVEVFLGLPYASPPVASLRLMPPVSGSPWSGTKMNEEPAPVCPQVLPSIANETEALKRMPKGRLAMLKRLVPLLKNQSEDCLYLNIYVPLSVANGKAPHNLPVLVFVHGEDFGFGAGHPYDPSMLSTLGNIIVVTMNYRIGILGFLNSNSDGYFKSPANFAMLDQIAALHWVQENIGSFGGDRGNVTLMGHSKGAIFVNFLMISSAVPPVANGKAPHNLPVLVFVHGEDFGFGAGHPYDPSMLSTLGNIIVVTMNYRIGILGFLNSNSDGYFKSPANFAMLDQIAALHWVQENIGSFGGDRGNVTLMGHSKGAIFVNFLMISSAVPPELFHRVILMSGSALSPLAAGLSNGKDLAKSFASRVKCPMEPPSNMLHCLRQVPLQYFLHSEIWSYFGPSDDGIVIESGIRENILRDRLSHYPLLFGVAKQELLPYLSDQDAVYGLETERRRELLKQFIDGFYSVHRSEILAAAIHEYTDWERPVQHPISVRDETLDALADAQVVSPLVKVADIHSQSNSRTYFYVFEYQSKVSDYAQRLGCVPGEDLDYILGVPVYLSGINSEQTIILHESQSEWTSPTDGNSGAGAEMKLGFFAGNFTRNEVQLSQTLVHLWANFVRSGNPNTENPEGAPEAVGLHGNPGGNRFPMPDKSAGANTNNAKPKLIEWPSYDTLFKKYLTIDAKPRVRSHYRAHKLSFWLHLVPELMRNGFAAMATSNRPGPLNSSYNNSISGQPSYPVSEGSGTIHNSTTPHPPTIQLVGPPLWEQNPYYNTEGDVSGPLLGHGPHHHHNHHHHEADGFQIYSTALSVTIAVGCSLLILNILIFAAFYYQRDKRRSQQTQQQQQQQNLQSLECGGLGMTSDASQFTGLNIQQTSSAPTTPVRTAGRLVSMAPLKENGQLMNMVPPGTGAIGQGLQHTMQPQNVPMSLIPPMPNICGELPGSNVMTSGAGEHSGGNGGTGRSTSQVPTAHSQRSSTLPSKQRQRALQTFEMSMPDAILAAAMMLNYRQNNSPDFVQGSGSKAPRRPSLNMKEQLLLAAAASGNFGRSSGSGSVSGGSGPSSNVIQFELECGPPSGQSKTLPRPPKRSTPTVKFSPDTFSGGSGSVSSGGTGASIAGGVNTNLNVNTTPVSAASQQQTLKSSLKKSSNYSSSGLSEELKV